jgi:lysophospholipase L1-like esterase
MKAWMLIATLAWFAGPALAAPPPPGSTYVALGSSYAAGTRLPQPTTEWAAQCAQGSGNYARQVAAALQLKLIDRSCGGAVNADILKGGQFGLPAQVDGLTADTRLVTITGGGNDVRFVSDSSLFNCRLKQLTACATAPADFDLERAFADLDTSFHALIAEVRRRAPQARIVIADYPTIAPLVGTCDALGLSLEDAAIMRERARRLSVLTARVAADAGVDLVKASDLTLSHNACSPDPWVWGGVSPEERAAGAAAFHPRPQSHTAVAAAMVQRLRAVP